MDEEHYGRIYIWNEGWSFSQYLEFKSTELERQTVIFTVPDGVTKLNVTSYLYPNDEPRNGEFYVKYYKVEKGRLATGNSENLVNYLQGSRMDNLSWWVERGGNVSLVSDPRMGKVVQYSRPSGGGDFEKLFNVTDKTSLANSCLVYMVIAKDMTGGGQWTFGGWDETVYALSSDTANKIHLGDGWFAYWTTFKSEATIGGDAFGINSIKGTWCFFDAGIYRGIEPPRNLFLDPGAVNYMKAALQGSTEINGGLMLTNLLMMRNYAGDQQAGMSGLDEDNVAFWGGGTYSDALADLAKIILRKDGSGQLAGGGVSWDTVGNTKFIGEVNATSGEFSGKVTAIEGKIGGFNIGGAGLTNNFNSEEAYIMFRYDPMGIVASIGTNTFPVSAQIRGAGRFENAQPDGRRNVGLAVSARNATDGNNFAIEMNGGFIGGFAVHTQQVGDNKNGMILEHDHCYISCYNTANLTLNLPDPGQAELGKIYYIRKINSAGVQLQGKIYTNVVNTNVWVQGYAVTMLINDGQYWVWNSFGY